MGTQITTDNALTAYLERLADRGVREVAFDLEGEFNLHVYGERLCLLQVADGTEEVVIDPYTITPELFASLLENSGIAKVTYDSSSDRALLAKTVGARMRSIVDLRPAVSLLEFARHDLKSVLTDALGVVEPGGKKRFQQYNWTRRPIEPAAIEYALQDVRHLLPLRDELFRRLGAAGRLDDYLEENARLEAREPDLHRKPGVFRSGTFKRLRADQKREFERLYAIRDRYARELDLPPNTVVANAELMSVALGRMSASQITGNRRVPTTTLQRIREELSKR